MNLETGTAANADTVIVFRRLVVAPTVAAAREIVFSALIDPEVAGHLGSHRSVLGEFLTTEPSVAWIHAQAQRILRTLDVATGGRVAPQLA